MVKKLGSLSLKKQSNDHQDTAEAEVTELNDEPPSGRRQANGAPPDNIQRKRQSNNPPPQDTQRPHSEKRRSQQQPSQDEQQAPVERRRAQHQPSQDEQPVERRRPQQQPSQDLQQPVERRRPQQMQEDQPPPSDRSERRRPQQQHPMEEQPPPSDRRRQKTPQQQPAEDEQPLSDRNERRRQKPQNQQPTDQEQPQGSDRRRQKQQQPMEDVQTPSDRSTRRQKAPQQQVQEDEQPPPSERRRHQQQPQFDERQSPPDNSQNKKRYSAIPDSNISSQQLTPDSQLTPDNKNSKKRHSAFPSFGGSPQQPQTPDSTISKKRNSAFVETTSSINAEPSSRGKHNGNAQADNELGDVDMDVEEESEQDKQGDKKKSGGSTKRRFSFKGLFSGHKGDNKGAKDAKDSKDAKDTDGETSPIEKQSVPPPHAPLSSASGDSNEKPSQQQGKFSEKDLGVPIPEKSEEKPSKHRRSLKRQGSGAAGFFSRLRSHSTGDHDDVRSANNSVVGITSSTPTSAQSSFNLSSNPATRSPRTLPRHNSIPAHLYNKHQNQPPYNYVQHVARPNQQRPANLQGVPQQMPRMVALVPGTSGLSNTDGLCCFMNCIFQCLAVVDPLAQYLCTTDYNTDIETIVAKWSKEPKRDLVDALANFLRSMWRLTYRTKITDCFRIVLQNYRPDLAVPEQQDAHEFLLFLINTMHEELNQSRKKLYRASKSKADAHMLSAVDVANSAAEISKRNQSIVYKLFAGLQQSYVTCPQCRGIYRSLESYMCLSLPIPTKQTQPVYLTHIDMQCRQTRHAFMVNLDDKVFRLRRAVSRRVNVDAPLLILAEMTPAGYGRSFLDDESIQDIVEISNNPAPPPDASCLYALELPPVVTDKTHPHFGYINLIVVHAEIIKLERAEEYDEEKKSRRRKKREKVYKRLTVPMVLSVDQEISQEELEKTLLDQLGKTLDYKIPRDDPISLNMWVMDAPGGDFELSTDETGLPPFHDHPEVDKALLASCGDQSDVPCHLHLLVVWNHKQRFGLLPDEVLDMRDEVTLDSSVSVISRQYASLGDGQEDTSNKAITLQECLQSYMGEQRLSADDKWTCPKCKVLQRAYVGTNLWTTPDVLVLHLKRFKTDTVSPNTPTTPTQEGVTREGAVEGATENGDQKTSQKLDVKVSIPITDLDIRPYLEKANGLAVHRDSLSGIDRQDQYSVPEDYIYDLISVACHRGDMKSGHYTACCKNPYDSKWRHFNDSTFREVLPDQVQRAEAYICFYQRRSSLQRCRPPPSVKHWSASRLDLPFVPANPMTGLPGYMTQGQPMGGGTPITVPDGPATPIGRGSIRRHRDLSVDSRIQAVANQPLAQSTGNLQNNSVSHGAGLNKQATLTPADIHQQQLVIMRRQIKDIPHSHRQSHPLGANGHVGRLSAAAIESAILSGVNPGNLFDSEPRVARSRFGRQNSTGRKKGPRVNTEYGGIAVKTGYRSTVHVPRMAVAPPNQSVLAVVDGGDSVAGKENQPKQRTGTDAPKDGGQNGSAKPKPPVEVEFIREVAQKETNAPTGHYIWRHGEKVWVEGPMRSTRRK